MGAATVSPMKPLHHLQAKLLEALRDVPEGGYSLEELRRAIGASYKSQVVHHMEQLEMKGLIKNDPDNPDNYIIFNEQEGSEEPFFFMPVLALASAGKGMDNSHHVIERIPVRSKMIPCKMDDAFLVQADGDSMEPRIHHKDFLVVERLKSDREPLGQIVVCEEGHEVKVKQFTRSGGSIVLVSLNQKYDPYVVTNPDNFRIHGIVRSVLFSKL